VALRTSQKGCDVTGVTRANCELEPGMVQYCELREAAAWNYGVRLLELPPVASWSPSPSSSRPRQRFVHARLDTLFIQLYH
jgi:hypothetical protein